MKIADRYILGRFLGMFLGSLITISFLFTVLSVLDSITRLMGMDGATFGGIIHYYLLQLPQTIYMSSPVAALLSCMITLGSMNPHNELMVLRAAGVSLARAAASVVAATLVISVFLFALGNTLVPVGNRQFLSAKQVLTGDDSDPGERIWHISESGDRNPVIVRIEKLDRASGDIKGLTIFRTGDEWRLEQEMVAESASYVPGDGWRLERAAVRSFHGNEVPVLSRADETLIDFLDPPAELLRVQRSPEEMTLSELNDQINRIRRYGQPDSSYQVERHSRFAIPLAAIILVLTGAPLAIRPVRSSGLAWGILGAIIVGFGYFVIIALFISLGKGGLVEPWAAAWSANIIFGIIGISFYKGLRK
jgi:lipopolysaccharide export system permease protein